MAKRDEAIIEAALKGDPAEGWEAISRRLMERVNSESFKETHNVTGDEWIRLYDAVNGIAYGMGTGRVGTPAEIRIETMGREEYAGLVAEIAGQNLRQAKIPAYLNERYGTTHLSPVPA